MTQFLKAEKNIAETNYSIEVIQDENDFFSEMYSNTGLKQFTIAIFFLGTFLGLLSMSGIIWYERRGNHRYRTVVNQLVSMLAWIVVLYISFVYIPEGVRYLIGPLNETYCEVYIFLKNVLFFGAVLALDCICILRYAFIFKLTNFAVVNDDLIAKFLGQCVVFVSVWLYMVKKMSSRKRLLHYCMCAGKDPMYPYEKSEPKTMPGMYFTIILICISVILHVFVFTKIFLYQRKIEQDKENIEIGRINTSEGDRQKPKEAWSNKQPKRPTNFLSQSILDFTTQLLCIMYLVAVSILQGMMSSIEPSQLNDYNNRWYVYFLQIIGVAVAIHVISCVYYAKNKLVSQAIWRRIKERYQD